MIEYKEEMRQFIDKLNYYTNLYDKSKPMITDEYWDKMYFELKEAEDRLGIIYPDSPTQNIIYNIQSNLKKIKHNHLMLSLAKTKSTDEVKAFLGDKNYIAMAKMDGLTCSLCYENGVLVSAETRGDGYIGEDILHNAKVIKNIPNNINYKNRLVVDGEIICTYSDFKAFSYEYKNPRNFASGSIRLLDPRECKKRNLSFVAWEVVEGFEEYEGSIYLHNCLYTLENLGFDIVPFVAYYEDPIEDINDIKDDAKLKGYPIDGVVFKYNEISLKEKLGHTEHHYNNGLAFKFTEENYETELSYIDWTIGRNGILTPVAIFKPVIINGNAIARASLHNLDIMRKTLGDYPYINQPIQVYLANDIIPQIISNEEDFKEEFKRTIHVIKECPYCHNYSIEEKLIDNTNYAVCTNEYCKGTKNQIITHYCSKKGLDIKGLSEQTIEKLIDWKWIKNVKDIYELKEYSNAWSEKVGFGKKSVNNIIQAIENSKNCELYKFIAALGIPEIGINTAKELCKHFKSWLEFKEAINDDNYKFYNIKGFGYEMNKSLKEFDYSEADEIYEKYLNINKIEENSSDNNFNLDNINVCITGKLNNYKRDELKAIIESRGGKVVGSVTSKTNYLITNTPDSGTEKNKKAKELETEIITELDFLKKYDII